MLLAFIFYRSRKSQNYVSKMKAKGSRKFPSKPVQRSPRSKPSLRCHLTPCFENCDNFNTLFPKWQQEKNCTVSSAISKKKVRFSTLNLIQFSYNDVLSSRGNKTHYKVHTAAGCFANKAKRLEKNHGSAQKKGNLKLLIAHQGTFLK